MNILQNFIFSLPDVMADVGDAAALFYRGEAETAPHALKFSSTVRFDTFFNLFPIRHYVTYTNLCNIGLSLRGTGHALIRLYGVRSGGGETSVRTEHIILTSGQTVSFPVQDIFTYEYIFVEMEALDGPFTLCAASWWTHAVPRRVPRIALVICSYKREAQLAANLSVLQRFILEHPEMHYDVLVVDNEGTLREKEIVPQSGHFSLFTNICNMGGSGGFGRGMREAGKCAAYTHMLLMDDDICLHSEMLFRLERFLRHLINSEKTAVGGIMLDRENPATVVEWGAYFPGHPIGIRRGASVARSGELLPPTQKAEYSAWTFFCYPLTDQTRKEEPLPFFLRADDAEFGLRLRKKFGIATVTRQGLAVWHHAFRENSPLVTYYTIRNELIINRLYDKITPFLLLRYTLVPLYFLWKGKKEHARAALRGMCEANFSIFKVYNKIFIKLVQELLYMKIWEKYFKTKNKSEDDEMYIKDLQNIISACEGAKNWREYSNDHFIKHLINNKKDFEIIYNMLEDEVSKKTFDWLIGYRFLVPIFGECELWVTENPSPLYSIFPGPLSIKRFKETYSFAKKHKDEFDICSEVYCVWHTFILKHYIIEGIYKPQKGNVIFDVGGYSGDTALHFSPMVGKEGKIFIFEPNEENCKKICKNMRHFNVENIEIIKKGLYSKEGILYLNTFTTSEKPIENSVEIQCTTIDTFVKEKNIQKLDYIKFDIEGGERAALEGAVDTINNLRPALAVSIYHRGNFGYQDFYTLPLYLKEICPKYKFYLRHLNASLYESVLFCIPF